jgi:hypothetical protein
VAFIDEHRERFGVEPICRVLSEHGCKIAPNTFWVARKRPPSRRAVRDEELVVEIRRLYDENLFVFGATKSVYGSLPPATGLRCCEALTSSTMTGIEMAVRVVMREVSLVMVVSLDLRRSAIGVKVRMSPRLEDLLKRY